MSVRQSRFVSDRLSAGARRGGAVSDRHSGGVSRTAKTNLQRVCAEGGKSGIMPSVENARRRGDHTRKFRADEVKCAKTHGSNPASEGISPVRVYPGFRATPVRASRQRERTRSEGDVECHLRLVLQAFRLRARRVCPKAGARAGLGPLRFLQPANSDADEELFCKM